MVSRIAFGWTGILQGCSAHVSCHFDGIGSAVTLPTTKDKAETSMLMGSLLMVLTAWGLFCAFSDGYVLAQLGGGRYYRGDWPVTYWTTVSVLAAIFAGGFAMAVPGIIPYFR
jgi:hypothetical protein